MNANKKDWPRLNISLPPDVLAAVDKAVARMRKERPDLVVTRLDLIRDYIREGLPS